jgi:hypothetical protein
VGESAARLLFLFAFLARSLPASCSLSFCVAQQQATAFHPERVSDSPPSHPSNFSRRKQESKCFSSKCASCNFQSHFILYVEGEDPDVRYIIYIATKSFQRNPRELLWFISMFVVFSVFPDPFLVWRFFDFLLFRQFLVTLFGTFAISTVDSANGHMHAVNSCAPIRSREHHPWPSALGELIECIWQLEEIGSVSEYCMKEGAGVRARIRTKLIDVAARDDCEAEEGRR